MSELTDADVADLLQLNKHIDISENYTFPTLGEQINIPLLSEDKREKFFLDISRGSINLNRVTFQTRAKVIFPLVRLDIDGRPHRNPDGSEIGVPHVHIYKHGYADKWAYSPVDIFGEAYEQAANMVERLDIFMNFCNIATRPEIEGDLFT
ncbi:DUF6978 family protein [Leptospira stimsonii]|uniref:DUF6978 family protein n=1 Tax=Leptospira stimsonii TaxID=2202203 RepID=UPI0019D652E8|nr:hypothetical protein [Leptospira stimsonii]